MPTIQVLIEPAEGEKITQAEIDDLTTLVDWAIIDALFPEISETIH